MVIAVTGICGILGIIVNLIPSAIGSAVVFCGFLVGLVVMGLYTAIVVASYPTYLRYFIFIYLLAISRDIAHVGVIPWENKYIIYSGIILFRPNAAQDLRIFEANTYFLALCIFLGLS